MHEALRMLGEARPLRDPIMLAAFTGFSDGAGAATRVIRKLVDAWDAQPLADIDPERFYDFTVNRPRTRVVDGQRTLDWPENKFWVATPPGLERDVLLLAGVEPHLRWRTFCAAIEDVLRQTGTTSTVTLGAQPSAVPHTRPGPVTLSASHPEFEELFGLKAPTSRYQGQTGIVGVLNVHLRNLGWHNASLWAMTPHYLTVGPNPYVALQLVSLVNRALGITTPVDDLNEEAEQFDDQVRQVLDESDEAKSYVRQLEEQYDSSRPSLPPGPVETPELPPTPDILDDLERFLREQRRDER